ncbi:MAG: hypothetical protein HDT38_01585 [Clostridiales bacterium]|nr:hypothetical protein [Clostridiales bacterium]
MRFRVDRKVIRAAAGFLVVLALLLGGALLLYILEEGGFRRGEPAAASQPPEDDDDGERIFYDGAWYAPRDDIETVLVLGLDRSDREGIAEAGDYAQSDLMMLLEIDRANGACRAIHLNRDTMTDIQDFDRHGQPNGTYMAQLTLAYAHAQAYTRNDTTACMASVKAVSGLLYGVKIHHYVTLTMDGLMELNDLVGGVEVEIRDDFSAVDPTLVQGERVTLLGEHALNYVRARWYVGDSTNLERMERQQEYMMALQEKLSVLAEGDEEFILSSLLEINEYMNSDCTVQQLAQLAKDIQTCPLERYSSLEGEAVRGEEFMEFYADEDALRRLVIEDFYEPVEEP